MAVFSSMIKRDGKIQPIPMRAVRMNLETELLRSVVVLSHIVLATFLRCPRIFATKPMSITFGDWSNANGGEPSFD
jgi:hypothetical protein